MRRDCPVQAKTAEHGDHVERAVTGDESVAIARGCDGIADYLLLDSHRASDRQISALGIVHDWTIQPAHCRACSHTGHSCRRPRPEECRQRYPRGALVDG
ncbi:MAG: hypothetical protein E6G79_03155 [Alphaproteobacteria bacterium]|jgi:hypothetical protein|nr:MAG: hypothetical protein E6G79_03155 [Alphaproteobacteria bacterium]